MRTNRDWLDLAQDAPGADLAELLLTELAEKAQRLHDQAPTLTQRSAFGHARRIILRVSAVTPSVSAALHAEAQARARMQLTTNPQKGA